MQPLLDRRIEIPGTRLEFDLSAVDRIFWRALHSDDFDVTEMSLAAYCILMSRGERPFVGIPVFTSRMFRHSSIYVHRDSGITRPEDLRGRRIGIPEYQMTAVVWMRGVLEEYYGVAAREVKWFKGGVGTPGRIERIPLRLPDGYDVTEIPVTDTLQAYLLDGRIDALITAKMPPAFLEGDARMVRLFSDPVAAERKYFAETGIFPIMHVLVMRQRAYDAAPELAARLLEAFENAKAVSLARLYDTDALPYMVPWLVPDMEDTFAALGRDFWPYGIARNRAGLQTFLDYLRCQDLLETPVEVNDLFAPEFVDT
ncbi:ABC transporter substrate-binding protein [Xanthobacter pseudotagetidis]|uniref:ABC transporter substrate-binding protein n=1 Tax=Xanthobacter pseudotagetidis TaxID=3119911 RepID=UPI00372B2AC9